MCENVNRFDLNYVLTVYLKGMVIFFTVNYIFIHSISFVILKFKFYFIDSD